MRTVDLAPDRSASSSTVVDRAVERFTSSLTIRSDSMASRMPCAVAAIGVVPDLGPVAEDVERVLPLRTLRAKSGTTCESASLTLPDMTSVSRALVARRCHAVERRTIV